MNETCDICGKPLSHMARRIWRNEVHISVQDGRLGYYFTCGGACRNTLYSGWKREHVITSEMCK